MSPRAAAAACSGWRTSGSGVHGVERPCNLSCVPVEHSCSLVLRKHMSAAEPGVVARRVCWLRMWAAMVSRMPAHGSAVMLMQGWALNIVCSRSEQRLLPDTCIRACAWLIERQCTAILSTV